MSNSQNIFGTSVDVIAILKRKQLINIDNSYNNEWDLLAELAQNSIDAINQKGEKKKNKINIIFNKSEKTISFEDNGIGFEVDKSKPNSLLGQPTLLDINVTSKSADPNQIGEKGVGLKFVIFNSNQAVIQTSDGKNEVIIELKNLLNWKEEKTNDLPSFQPKIKKSTKSGTKITLSKLGERFDKLFQLSKEQLLFVLRTKTALGRTSVFWNKNENDVKIQLEYIDEDNDKELSVIDSTFHHLAENHTNTIDFDDYIAWTQKADRNDKQKRNKLRNKILTKKGEYIEADTQRKIKFFVLFAPNRMVFEDTSIDAELCTREQLDDSQWIENFGFTLFKPGIEISSKGMPTGIKIPTPNTGWAGYWEQTYMMFEDDFLTFDIGRKSIDGRSARKISEYAKKEFNNLLKIVTKYITGSAKSFNTKFNKVKTFKSIDKIKSLNSEKSLFEKSPGDQEASVAAIFYELIGSGVIQNITPIITGYKETYDLYANVIMDGEPTETIIEFKSQLKNLLPDLQRQIKFTNDIDCIVCYNVTDAEIDLFEDQGYSVEEYEGLSKEFPNATHKVTMPGAKEYWIIDLAKLL